MGEAMKGYNVCRQSGKTGRIVSAWRPDHSAAVMYARTLSRTVPKGDTVYVEDAETKERKWTLHV